MRAGEIVDGRFEIDRPLGAGGMGQVYLARDLPGGAPVAVKVLRGTGARDRQRFSREAEVLASLRIPGVVRYIAHGATATGRPYLAMEWLDGETLEDRLARGPLGIAEGVTLARRVAETLAAIHQHGVIHRDLKPGNLLLVGGELARVMLLDFGIARTAALDFPRLTLTGAVVGTPAYMAPEQVRGLPSIDARADLFALGCVLYECIVGRSPFFASDLLSLLMKVILEEPLRLQQVRADVPAWLDALVARLLAKAPEERPHHAGIVAAALAAPESISLDQGTGNLDPSAQVVAARGEMTLTQDPGVLGESTPGPMILHREAPTVPQDTGAAAQGPRASGNITASERKVQCILVAEMTCSTNEITIAEETDRQRTRALREAVARHGSQLDILQGRWLLVVLSGAAAPTDLATRAARCALALRGLLVGMPIAVATGRAEADSPAHADELIARAVHLLDCDLAQAGGAIIRIDEVTVPLLEQRFDVVHDAVGHWLIGARDELSPTRRLLGRPTAFVGRDRELGILLEEIRGCCQERAASAVLVTGPAGAGKSRLRHELVSRIHESHKGVEVWTGLADPMRAGSAFAMLSSALRRVFDLREGEPIDVRRRKVLARVERHRDLESPRVAVFLGELIGVPFPDDDDVQLRAARREPMLMGDQLRLAWEEFLRAECAMQPVLLVLEDLHWGDLPTVNFIDIALRQEGELPFLALALARPEVHELFPGMWKDRRGQELRLNPLPRRASEKLVRQVMGDAVSDALVARLAERADGNPFFLEELIRAASSDENAAFPETVLAMVQARLEALPPEARRVLRAASVFGQSFRQSGVAVIAGEAGVVAELTGLERREIITRRGLGLSDGNMEYRFRHALLREAAYGMLTERDRRVGHALAGEWLERNGDADPIALAEHFQLGGEPARAARAYLHAAEQALRGNDLIAAIERAERGMACAPVKEIAGALRIVQAEAHNWRGEIALAKGRGNEAVELLPEGSARWFSAVGQVVLATAKLGAVHGVERWSVIARDAAVGDDAPDARSICLADCAANLIVCGSYTLADALLEATKLATNHPHVAAPEALARYYLARAFRAPSNGEIESSLQAFEVALDAFEQTGDRRNACATRVNLAFTLGELGNFAGAESLMRVALTAAEQMGLMEVIANIQNNLGRVLACAGKLDEAKVFGQAALEAFQRMNSRRMTGNSRIYLARLALLTGDTASAEREARAAADALEIAPPLRPLALTVLARALLIQGRLDEALDAAREAYTTLEMLGGVEEGESFIRLVYAETLDATGYKTEAAQAIAAANTMLLARADKLRDPRWRESFLGNIPEHVRTRELMRRWFPGEPSSR